MADMNRCRAAFLSIFIAMAMLAGGALQASARPVQTAPAKFAHPSDMPNCFIFTDVQDAPSYQRRRMTMWTDAEKEAVRKVLRAIACTHPRLLRSALCISSIKLYRLQKREDAMAETDADGIAFERCYFREGFLMQYYGLLHELAHWCDGGYQVSYSRKWIAFAQPEISKIRCRRVLFGDDYAGYSLRAYRLWPTLHATKNLTEAVAEGYTASAITMDCDRKLSKFNLYLLDEIENLTPEKIEYIKHFRAGMDAAEDNRHTEAIRSLLRAIRIAPEQPAAHAWLVSEYLDNEERENAVLEEATANKLCDKAGVPKHDRIRELIANRMHWRSKFLGSYIRSSIASSTAWNDRTAKSYIDKVTDYIDEDPQTIAFALLNENDPVARKLTQLVESDADQSFVQDRLLQYVEKEHQSPASLRLRGMWYETQGDQAKSAPARARFYALAQADYEMASKKVSNPATLQALIVSTLAKLGSIKRAEQLHSTLCGKFGMTAELRAARIAILQAQKKLQDARKELHALVEQWMPHKERSNPCDDVPLVRDIG